MRLRRLSCLLALVLLPFPVIAARHFSGGGGGAGALYNAGPTNTRYTKVEVVANQPFTWSVWFRSTFNVAGGYTQQVIVGFGCFTGNGIQSDSCPADFGQSGLSKAERVQIYLCGPTGGFLPCTTNGQLSLDFEDFAVNTVACTSSQVVEGDNLWHHVAFTRDSTTIRGYLDGTQMCSVVDANAVETGSGCQLNMGFEIDCSSQLQNAAFYTGDIAEFAIWKAYQFTPQEIGALSHGTPPNKLEATRLTVYWPLYGATGGTTSGQVPESECSFTGTQTDNFAVITCAVGCEFAPVVANHCPCNKPGDNAGR